MLMAVFFLISSLLYRKRKVCINAALWRVRVTIVSVEKQPVLHILSVCL